MSRVKGSQPLNGDWAAGLYGVPATLGLLPGRVTFVIGAVGVVRHVLNSQLAATRHVAEALGTLRRA